MMSSIPQLSIIKGPLKAFEPCLLHRKLEDSIKGAFNSKQAIIELTDTSEIMITFNMLDMLSNQIAHAILHEIKPIHFDDSYENDYVICVSMEPSIELIIALLGVWKTGAAYMPLDTAARIDTTEHVLNDAKPILIIHNENHPNTSLFGDYTSISFDKLKLYVSQTASGPVRPADTYGKGKLDIAVIFFTSGSTGISRGVRLSHANIQNRMLWQWNTFPYNENEIKTIFKTSIAFIDSVAEIWSPLFSGLTLVIVNKNVQNDIEKLIDVLEKYEIQRITLVPTILRTLLLYLSVEHNAVKLKNLKLIISSGEPLTAQLAKDFYKQFSENEHTLCNLYGTTETMGDVTYFVCSGSKQVEKLSHIPIGRTVYNSIVYLLDSDLRPVKNGLHGDIYVSGANVCRGFVNSRDADKFIHNYFTLDDNMLFKTGDYGCYRNGVIFFSGRIDSRVKVRGKRVDLTDIELHLMELPGIERVSVFCYRPGELNQCIVAFIKMQSQGRQLASFEIQALLKDKLPSYSIPYCIVVNSIPLLLNGKVDKQGLLKLFENMEFQTKGMKMDYRGVDDKKLLIAKDLFETVRNTLGISIVGENISIKSDFFQIGGNSLNVMLAVADLKMKGYFINISQFVTAKTLGEILKKLKYNYSDCSLLRPHDKLFSENYIRDEVEEHRFEEIASILTSSFYGKGKLEGMLKPQLTANDLREVTRLHWPQILEHNLSFVVKRYNANKIIGVCINYDLRREKPVDYGANVWKVIAEFCDCVEAPVKKHLPMGKNCVLHNLLMGTHSDLSSQENVALMFYMEEQIIKLAEEKNFNRILTVNTSELSQAIALGLDYTVMEVLPSNEFTYHDGTKPFLEAPSLCRGIAAVKYLNSSDVYDKQNLNKIGFI